MIVKTILAKEFEGCKLQTYQDQKGVWTIGWGHTSNVKKGDVCTQEQADNWLKEDLVIAEQAVNHFVKVPLTQNQFDALVDFTFNLGSFQLRTSTLLTKVNNGDFSGAANEFPKWKYVDGKENQGIIRRRLAEKKLFNS